MYTLRVGETKVGRNPRNYVYIFTWLNRVLFIFMWLITVGPFLQILRLYEQQITRLLYE